MPSGLRDVIATAGGWPHSLVLKRDGTVVAWGNNEFGQTNVPSDLRNVTAIAAGGAHSLALVVPDTTAPTTTFIYTASAPNASGWYTSDVNVSVQAHDTVGGSGIAETRCVFTPSPTAPAPQTFADLPSGCTYTNSTLMLGEGIKSVYAASSDQAGNQEAVQHLSVKIDTTAPTVSASVSQVSPSASATVTLQASDTLSGVATTSYAINNGVPRPYTGPFVLNAAGSYLISFTSSDTAGNSSAPQSRTVTVAPLAPAHSASVEQISAPPSVVANTLESNQLIRLFAERQNYTLPTDVRVNGSVIAAGTRVMCSTSTPTSLAPTTAPRSSSLAQSRSARR